MQFPSNFFLAKVSLFTLLSVCAAAPILAVNAADSPAAETFSAPPDLSRIYLKLDDRYKTRSGLTLQSENTEISVIFDDQYTYFDVSPGTYSFRLYFPKESKSWQNFAKFDLSLSVNTVALVHCEHRKIDYKFTGNPVGVKRTKAPALMEFNEVCAGVDLESTGIKSCQVLNPMPLKFDDFDMDLPLGTCQLIHDTAAFKKYEQVDSKLSTYLSTEAYDYQLALKASSLQSYQKFLSDYPMSLKRAEIEILISDLSAQEAAAALEKEINSVVKRDAVLPLQARHDKYMIALTGYLQNQDFKPSLLYFELLDRLNVEQSPSITHFWGEALLRTGQPKEALVKLYEYIKAAGTSGTYYRDALALINEAEKQ